MGEPPQMRARAGRLKVMAASNAINMVRYLGPTPLMEGLMPPVRAWFRGIYFSM